MIQKKRSLMFKLMTAIGLVAMVILMAMTAFIFNKATKSMLKQIDNEITSLMDSIKYTTAGYVKAGDLKTIQSIATDIIHDPTINEVYFYDKDKKLIAKAINTVKDPHDTGERFETKANIIDLGAEKNEPVGFITIKYNHNDVYEIKQDLLWTGIIAIIVSQLILAAVLWFFLSRSVKAINSTTDKLKGISDATETSSKDLENLSTQVSNSANEQAASIQETVATLDQITSQVTATVESVSNSTKKSEESLGIATEGKAVVTEMILSMEAIGVSNKEIMEEIARGNERIGGIVKIINEISEKTSVINDIVFQTKLLSFNASVESARAGEHGKGFAVVAEEVGKLAQVSGKASTEISGILEDSIIKVNNVIEETNRNVKQLTDAGVVKVQNGMKVADRCGTVLEDIVVNASIIKNMLNEISVASKEQAEGVRNIAAAMNQLDQATLSNNRAAETSSENAKQLSTHASSLHSAVRELEIEVLGGVKDNSSHSSTKVVSKSMQIVPGAVVSKKSVEKSVEKSIEKPVEKKAEAKILPMVTKKEVKKPVLTVAASNETKNKNQGATPAYNDPRFEDV